MKNGFLDYKVFALPDISKMGQYFSGENEKHILVAFNDAQTDETTAFITKIMASVQINLEKDCTILRGGDIPTIPTFSQISNHYTIQKAILFGISPKELHLNIDVPLYMPFTLNGCTFLFADSLSKINTEVTKRAVWNCLKHIFS